MLLSFVNTMIYTLQKKIRCLINQDEDIWVYDHDNPYKRNHDSKTLIYLPAMMRILLTVPSNFAYSINGLLGPSGYC